MSVPLAEGAGWREVPEPPTPAADRSRWTPRAARWEVRPPTFDARAWTEAVAEMERAFGARGVCAEAEAGWLWGLGTARRRVLLIAEGVADEPVLTVTVTWSAPRPWLPALAVLCLPTAFVMGVVLLSRPSALAEWLTVLALAALPLIAATAARAAARARHAHTRWRIRRVLRVPPERSPGAVWVDAEEVADEDLPDAERLPEAVGPAEWLSADEWDGLVDARPARVASADLRHPRRVVGRPTAEPRASVPLPDGFTEWRPARTP